MRALSSHSKGNERETLAQVREAWGRDSSLRSDCELEGAFLLAEAHTGHLNGARSEADRLLGLWQRSGKASDAAEGLLTRAALSLQAGDAARARTDALAAERIIAAQALPESDALSLLLAAEAARQGGNLGEAEELSKKSVDIFRSLALSWGNPAFRLYLARPDRQQALRSLAELRGAHGGIPDEILAPR